MNRPVNEIAHGGRNRGAGARSGTPSESPHGGSDSGLAQCASGRLHEGLRGDNPAGEAVGAALPKNGAKLEHFRALPHDRVRDALICVRGSGAWWATIAAFEFLVLSAARSGDVRGMEWSELDLDAASIWTVPVERMKAGCEKHRKHAQAAVPSQSWTMPKSAPTAPGWCSRPSLGGS